MISEIHVHVHFFFKKPCRIKHPLLIYILQRENGSSIQFPSLQEDTSYISTCSNLYLACTRMFHTGMVYVGYFLQIVLQHEKSELSCVKSRHFLGGGGGGVR